MSSLRLRRLGAGLAACAVALLTAVALPPATAHAARVVPKIEFDHLAVQPGSVGKAMFLSLSAPGSFALHGVTVTVDTSKLAGVATPELASIYKPACDQAATLITCHYDAVQGEEISPFHHYKILMFMDVRPLQTAKVDDEGSVAVKVTSRDYPALSRTAKVTVAEGVELAAGADTDHIAKPGGSMSVPVQVKNVGDVAVRGVDMFFYIEPWYTIANRYKNCWYSRTAGYCHFDAALAPGRAYRISAPMTLTVRRDIPAPSVIGHGYSWLTPTDNRGNIELVRAGAPKAGAGAAVTLVELPAAKFHKGVAQTDRSLFTNSQDQLISVTGSQFADVAAIGATVRGAVGATVTASVGAKNFGPAFVFGYPKAAATVTVVPPTGTTVVSVPDGCVAIKTAYVCTTTAMPFDPGKTVAWPFRLRITKRGKLVGAVVAKSSAADRNAANNSTKLIVNPPAARAAGGGGSDSPASSGPLAVTGASALLIGGTGLALAAGGAFVLAALRRRRQAAHS
jgi:hypothetical protein